MLEDDIDEDLVAAYDATHPRPSPAFKVGERIQAMYRASVKGAARSPGWFDGKVSVVHGDGTCDVEYDDGDTERFVQQLFICAMTTSSAIGNQMSDDDVDDE